MESIRGSGRETSPMELGDGRDKVQLRESGEMADSMAMQLEITHMEIVQSMRSRMESIMARAYGSIVMVVEGSRSANMDNSMAE